MSWEHDRYEAVCKSCGRTGFCIQSSDDWGHFTREWDGFRNLPPHPYAVFRMKSAPGDMSPVCECGSTDIDIGKRVNSR
jgi:hypothetical protein